MIGFIIGIFIGAAFGVIVMALLNVGKSGEEKEPPARLLTPGQTVVYDGDIWEITSFEVTSDGQTAVILTNGVESTIAPIEEVR